MNFVETDKATSISLIIVRCTQKLQSVSLLRLKTSSGMKHKISRDFGCSKVSAKQGKLVT